MDDLQGQEDMNLNDGDLGELMERSLTEWMKEDIKD